MTMTSSPAVKIQLIASAVKQSPTVEKILYLSNLRASDIKKVGDKIEILNPGREMPALEEKDWLEKQQIGAKTLNCIKNIW